MIRMLSCCAIFCFCFQKVCKQVNICNEILLKIKHSTDTVLFVVLLEEDIVTVNFPLTSPPGKGLCFMSHGESTTQIPDSVRGTSWAS